MVAFFLFSSVKLYVLCEMDGCLAVFFQCGLFLRLWERGLPGRDCSVGNLLDVVERDVAGHVDDAQFIFFLREENELLLALRELFGVDDGLFSLVIDGHQSLVPFALEAAEGSRLDAGDERGVVTCENLHVVQLAGNHADVFVHEFHLGHQAQECLGYVYGGDTLVILIFLEQCVLRIRHVAGKHHDDDG